VLDQIARFKILPETRRHAALHAFWEHWRSVDLTPSPQIKLGIQALAASVASEPSTKIAQKPIVLALILAGNTPLLAWPVLHYCLELGISVVIKESHEEKVWTRAFIETLQSIDAEVAKLFYLASFSRNDFESALLLQNADAVIAYGSDASIRAIRDKTPETTPFLGFGHALSIGLLLNKGDAVNYSGIAIDTLLYDQAGCLSPQAVFFEKKPELDLFIACFEEATKQLALPVRSELAECRRVREARDLALFDGCEVFGDAALRWTLIVHPDPCALPLPTGCCVLHLIPMNSALQLGSYLGPAKNRLSSVGVAGAISEPLHLALKAEGVSRICDSGQMQTPPLDWNNGGVDLRQWLTGLAKSASA
jgi:hypothetical protein